MRAHQSALSAIRRNAFNVGTAMPLLAVAFFSCLLSVRAAAPAAESAVDFPLALGTKWTDHLHQEAGTGVHFGPLMAKFAKGNSLDAPVITEVVGSDLINGEKYIRLESRIGGDTPWLTQWLRQTASGLPLGKTVNSEHGQEVELMVPPQKLLSPTLKTGESWEWKTPNAGVVMHIKVVGPADLTVPAGKSSPSKETKSSGILAVPTGKPSSIRRYPGRCATAATKCRRRPTCPASPARARIWRTSTSRRTAN